MDTCLNEDGSVTLAAKIASRTAVCGVIGLGYVGLPLAVSIADAGFRTIGFDVDEGKVRAIGEDASYVEAVASEELGRLSALGRLRANDDFAGLAGCDVVIVCVPTPLTRQREPDLGFVERSVEEIRRHAGSGTLIVLESTTWPGTTETIVKPILERGGARSGIDFYLGFSPERQDPGNRGFTTATIPKIVSGDGETATSLVAAFYGAVVDDVVEMSSTRAAEAVKITENVFRAVNIALVNELKMVFAAMDIDVWEVIDGAATKPFGFMPFQPGPGLGGHCIPIDPFYLTWKSREYDLPTRFIELAGEINVAMPRYVISVLERALDRAVGIALGRARVLILGLAYKRNVPDVRESPAFKLMDLLEERGTRFDYHDPHVPIVPKTREHAHHAGLTSVPLEEGILAGYDAIVLVTDHDAIDYALLGETAGLIVDTRNAFARRGIEGRIVKA